MRVIVATVVPTESTSRRFGLRGKARRVRTIAMQQSQQESRPHQSSPGPCPSPPSSVSTDSPSTPSLVGGRTGGRGSTTTGPGPGVLSCCWTPPNWGGWVRYPQSIETMSLRCCGTHPFHVGSSAPGERCNTGSVKLKLKPMARPPTRGGREDPYLVALHGMQR